MSRKYRPANITGTANIDTAHIFPEPRKTKYAKPDLFRGGGGNCVSNDDKEERKFKYKLAFETITDKKIVSQQKEHRLRQGKICFEQV